MASTPTTSVWFARGVTTSAPTTIRIAVEGPVATLTLHRPEALNAITPLMADELGQAIDLVSADPAVRVIVLTGEGRAFSAGVDLKALGQRPLDGGSIGDQLNALARGVIRRLTTVPQITIAKINGFCFTGALELALGCDLIVVAEEAKLGDTHAKWGLRPTWGMSQRLVKAIGVTRARELSYTARTFSGVEAAEWGLAIRAVPLTDLDVTVAELAATVAANSPGSLAAYKDLYRAALDEGLASGIAYEEATEYPIADAKERIAGFK